MLAGVVFVAALLRAQPAAETPGAIVEPPATPGPMILALGLALLVSGTLLGWVVGTLGAVVALFGSVRVLTDSRH